MCWFVLLAYLAVRGHQYTVGKPSSRRRRKKRERKEGERESGSYFGIKSTVLTRSKPVPNNSWHRQEPKPLEKRSTSAKTPPPKRPSAWRTSRRQGGQKGAIFGSEQADRPRGRFTAHMVSAVTDVKGTYLPPPRLVRGFLI